MSPLKIQNAHMHIYRYKKKKKWTQFSQSYMTIELFYLAVLISIMSTSCFSIDSLENDVLKQISVNSLIEG